MASLAEVDSTKFSRTASDTYCLALCNQISQHMRDLPDTFRTGCRDFVEANVRRVPAKVFFQASESAHPGMRSHRSA